MRKNKDLAEGAPKVAFQGSWGEEKDSHLRGCDHQNSFQQYPHIKKGEWFAGSVNSISERERKKSFSP